MDAFKKTSHTKKMLKSYNKMVVSKNDKLKEQKHLYSQNYV
jgi:hypothetical protein